MRLPLLPLAFLLSGIFAYGETVKDREGAVRKDRADMEADPRWIYNDVEKGFAAAKKEGKPLLVVLRCVPCLACKGIDSSVLTEPSLTPLLDRFVCVRVINANALDLSLFEFDYDLSFSTIFFHADRTVLGRFGSWSHQKDALDTSTAAFRGALEAVLALHRDYPANDVALAGKQVGNRSFKTPVDIPGLASKYKRDLDWDGKVVQSCVHCHQITDALRAMFREEREWMPDSLIYPMPAPETIGLTLAPDRVAHVQAVVPGSIADAAGFKVSDDLQAMDEEPLVSIADVTWALHCAPVSGSLNAVVLREGKPVPLVIPLPNWWRTKSDISRRVGTWPMRAMVTGGLVLEDLSDSDRDTRKLSQKAMALRVKAVGQYGKHAAGKNAGFQKEDVIVEFGGYSKRKTESELIGWALHAHRAGEKVEVKVLRGEERLDLVLPMQ